jgi:O-antigen/teichoic acid export membrane protein
LYKFVEKAVGTVLSMSSGSIHTVSFSQFSRFQDSFRDLQKSVETALRMSAAMSLPPLAGLAVISDPLMRSMGPDWSPASAALKALCIAGMSMTFANYTGPLLQAFGRPLHIAVLEWGRTGGGAVALIGAGLLVRNSSTEYQVLSIAMARLFTTYFFIIPVFIPVLLRESNISLRDFLISVLPGTLAAMAVVLCIAFFRQFATLEQSGIMALMSEIVVGAFGGITTLVIADQNMRRSVALIAEKIVRLSG